MNILILDTETTGIEKDDQVIEFGFMVFDGENIVGSYNNRCKPTKEITFGAMATHHITPEMLEDEPPLSETSSFRALEGYNYPENYIVYP